VTVLAAQLPANQVLAAQVPPAAIVVNSSTPLWYLTRAARADHGGPVGLPHHRPRPGTPGLLPLARRAVAACPTLALLLTDE